MKRLKQRHGDDDRHAGRRGLEEIFSDDEDDGDRGYGRNYRQQDEFDDFIEEDYPDDPDEAQRYQEDIEVSRSHKKSMGGVVDTKGLDKDALEDMEAIFSGSTEYEWALAMEDDILNQSKQEQGIELKDVFEPSQLAERMMTDEDNVIRVTDEPERFQLDRRQFKGLQLTPEQFKEECKWISNLMLKSRALEPDLVSPFTKAVGKVMEFFIVDELEVPYVFNHRKDYLIHTRRSRTRERGSGGASDGVDAHKLLTQDDLWVILEHDIKFRSLIERRNALERAYDNLKASFQVEDAMVEEMLRESENVEDIQDLQDYLHFRYSSQLRDLSAAAGSTQTKRPGSRSTLSERVRGSRAYRFVQAYGITADQFARNVMRKGPKTLPEDDAQNPDDLADQLLDQHFNSGDAVINAARQAFSEDIFFSPRVRKHMRETYIDYGVIDCRRTDKGLRKIDESHPFYEIKYLRNHTVRDMARRPELLLKMMKAEDEGLVEVRYSLSISASFRTRLHQEIASDNVSEKAERWAEERRKALDLALVKLDKISAKAAKEMLRTWAQDEILKVCRKFCFGKLDQKPFKPRGIDGWETPRVLAMSNGMGDPGRDPIAWVYLDEYGKVAGQGKLLNLARDEAQRTAFADLVRQHEPEVIGVSGWSATSHRLVRDVENLVSEKNLLGPTPDGAGDRDDDDEDGNDSRPQLLEVVVVNDEVARLYKDSARATAEHPNLHPLLRYCVALARYMQDPLKEYVALGKDITSLTFHECQSLLPPQKLARHLEHAMVDAVNLCGVNINDAVNDPYTANLLPYVAGLGPRKASSVIKAINANGGVVNSRDELVGDPDSNKVPVVGPRVWNNLASFLYIKFDPSNASSDPLDNTRVHPEDYELGRKMAADALELDEEDVKAETDQNGDGAVVRKLFKQGDQDKVNELVLEEYAEQLERNYNQKKRATLETIRAELQVPYEELRNKFLSLSASDVFTQFTGEWTGQKEGYSQDDKKPDRPVTLCRDMIVPVNVRVVKEDFVIVKLDSGIEGRIESHEIPHTRSVRDVVAVGQTVQAMILDISERDFSVKLTMKEDALRRPYRRKLRYPDSMWDYDLEQHDQDDQQQKDRTTGRTQRVVNHPLFKPFNSTQAEEYLGSRPNGEVVIRPSSLGNDHLAVTWKVADGVFQHVDVLELQKETEFALGRTLRVGGKYTYSDLDELIVEHIKEMSKKADELMRHEKYERKARPELGQYLAMMPLHLVGRRLLTILIRKMAHDVRGRQPEPVRVCVLHSTKAPGLLSAGFQDQPDKPYQRMAGQGRAQSIRDAGRAVPRHARVVQRIQTAPA
jgi:transcription elongation factor SPT6